MSACCFRLFFVESSYVRYAILVVFISAIFMMVLTCVDVDHIYIYMWVCVDTV